MRIIYLFILAISFSLGSQAQEIWDLEKCINYAIEHSIDIRQADLSIDEAEIDKKLSEQQRMPSLSSNVNASSNFGRTVDPTSNEFITANFISNNFGLNAGVILYDGNRIKNNIKRSIIEKNAFESDKSSMTFSVTLNVVTSYFEALLATDNLKNAEIQLKTVDDQIAQMRKLVDAGSRAQFEIYDLEAQFANIEQQLTLAQNRIDLAMLSLKGVMNLDPNTNMMLKAPPVDQLTYTDLDKAVFEDIYNNVAGSRPELQALNYRISSSEIGVDVAKSAYYPTISFGGNINSNFSNQAKQGINFSDQIINSPVFIDGNPAVLGTERSVPGGIENIPYFSQLDNNLFYGFGVQANIPIFDRYNAKGNTARAKINLERSRVDKDRYIIDLRNTLGQFLTDAKASKRTLEASNKLLAARQIAYDNAQKRFDLGAINSFDYISIQDQLNTARIEQIISKYDYMMKVKILDFYQGFPVSLK